MSLSSSTRGLDILFLIFKLWFWNYFETQILIFLLNSRRKLTTLTSMPIVRSLHYKLHFQLSSLVNFHSCYSFPFMNQKITGLRISARSQLIRIFINQAPRSFSCNIAFAASTHSCSFTRKTQNHSFYSELLSR